MDTAADAATATATDMDAPPAAELRPLRYHRNFVLLWTGQAVSAMGSSMATIVCPLLAAGIAAPVGPPLAGLLFDSVGQGWPVLPNIGSLPTMVHSRPDVEAVRWS